MKMRTFLLTAVAVMTLSGVGGAAFAAPAPDSKRMERAKGYFADEQWAHAIAEFRAVADDPREANRDEALFWLAQSEHETGDHSATIQTLARLERQFPKSPWVRFGRSLRVEIAQQMNRYDVLWAVVGTAPPPPPARPAATPFAVTPAPPAVAATPAPAPMLPTARPPTMVPPAVPARPPAAATPPATPQVAPPAPPAPPARGPGPRGGRSFASTPPVPAPPALLMPGAEYFLPTPYPPDTDLKIQALSGLLEGHGERVIPLLREIALDGNSPDEGRRAIIVLAQSHRPDARTAVADVARRGAEPVRLVAIREMGRFEGAGVSAELMQVYSSGPTPRVKRQIVSSLGERADNMALLRIANAELDATVRNTAIVTLGRLPNAQLQLRTLYVRAPQESRMAVLIALGTSKDEDELIRIARTEKEPLLRQRARMQLRMLGTPKALKFLEDNPTL